MTLTVARNPVRFEVQGARAVIEIDRPEALNALNSNTILCLQDILVDLEARDDVAVVVLCGAGDKAFVAGADVKEMQALSAHQAYEFSRLGNAVMARIEALPQIVVAKVQGFALGGGLELALAADFIIASSQARFGLPEVTLGLIPGFGGTQRLARRIGAAHALEWIATADKFSAEAAMSMGLVNRVVAHPELNSVVEKIVESIERNGPLAVRTAKRALRCGMQCPQSEAVQMESSLFGLQCASPEAREGMTAFVEKRPARFPRFNASPNGV